MYHIENIWSNHLWQKRQNKETSWEKLLHRVFLLSTNIRHVQNELQCFPKPQPSPNLSDDSCHQPQIPLYNPLHWLCGFYYCFVDTAGHWLLPKCFSKQLNNHQNDLRCIVFQQNNIKRIFVLQQTGYIYLEKPPLKAHRICLARPKNISMGEWKVLK